MTDTFRALCAELLMALEDEGYANWYTPPDEDELCLRARALLAQPVAEGPTDKELLMLYGLTTKHLIESGRGACNHLTAFARAVLAKWGRPTPQPVAVSERPWERDGWCDAEGRCYGWDGDYWWMVKNPGAVRETITHWLPANALPIPESP